LKRKEVNKSNEGSDTGGRVAKFNKKFGLK